MSIDFSKIGQPCALHELTGCSICSGLDEELAKENEEAKPERLAPGVVRAAWDGKCAGCGTSFSAGRVIRYSSALGGWTPVDGMCC